MSRACTSSGQRRSDVEWKLYLITSGGYWEEMVHEAGCVLYQRYSTGDWKPAPGGCEAENVLGLRERITKRVDIPLSAHGARRRVLSRTWISRARAMYGAIDAKTLLGIADAAPGLYYVVTPRRRTGAERSRKHVALDA